MRAPAIPEREVQAAICDYLDIHRIHWWRVSVAGLPIAGMGGAKKRNPMKGHPDLAGVHNGRYFVIEVKRRGKAGMLSPEQEKWRDSLRASGALWILATSVQDVKLAFIGAGVFDTHQ